MLEYTREVIAERTDHPLFAALFITAVIMTVTGVWAEATGQAVSAAFLVIFALMFATLGIIGYTAAFAAKIIAAYRERSSSI